MRIRSSLRGLGRRLKGLWPRREKAPAIIVPLLEEEKVKFTLVDKLDMFAYSLFGDLAAKVVSAFGLKKALAEAGMHTYPILYASRMIFVTLIATYLSYSIGIAGMFFTENILARVLIISVAIMAPMITLTSFLLYPSTKASARDAAIEHEMPFMAAYVTTIARGSSSIIKVFERLAEMTVLPASAEEARRVLRDVRLFGKDPLTALEDNALSHPNRHYRDFILGYTSTVRTGGDIIHYLQSKTEGLFEARAAVIRGIADKVAMMTELYVIIAVVMGLGFYIFFSIANIIPGAGGAQASIMNFLLFAYVFLPLFSVIVLAVINAIQPKTVLPMPEPYKALAYSIPLGIFFTLVILYVTGAIGQVQSGHITMNTIASVLLALTLGLVVLSGPPAFYYSAISIRAKGAEENIASFLRDLVEVRKTGLAPERCIIYVARREYGNLSPLLKDLARLISWGLPFKEAARRIIVRTRNWFARTILTFLVDAVDVGGGSVATLEALARFTFSLAEFEKELKSKLKPYVFMPYFGALINAVATLMIIAFSGETLKLSVTGSGISLPLIILYFTVSMLINGWLMGLVAGKISGRYLAAGFTHAVALTTMIYITIMLTMQRVFTF